MTAAVGISVGSLAVIGLIISFSWWLASWARRSSKDARTYHVRSAHLKRDIADRDDVISALTIERNAERRARATAQEAAERAIMRLVDVGTPDDIVSELNAQLLAISEMSNVPAAAGAGDNANPRPVHGRVSRHPSSDDTVPG